MAGVVHRSVVDVIVPLYRNERFAVDAVKSALDQTYPVRRVIVVDDGSADQSAAIVEKAFRLEPRVTVIRAAHGGPNHVRNIGIRNSDADFVACLDSDDLWHPSKIELQLDELQKDDGVLLVSCGFHEIDEDGQFIPNDVSSRHSGWVHELLLTGNFLSGGSAAVVRRSAFDAVGLFDESLFYGEEWDMWLRIAKVSPIMMLDADLVAIRKHRMQLSAQGGRGKKVHILNQHLAIWSKWAPEIEASTRAQMAVWRLIVGTSLRSGPGMKSRLSIMRLGFSRVRKNLGASVHRKLVWSWPIFMLRIAIEKITPLKDFKRPS